MFPKGCYMFCKGCWMKSTLPTERTADIKHSRSCAHSLTSGQDRADCAAIGLMSPLGPEVVRCIPA